MTKYELYEVQIDDIDLNKVKIRSNPDMLPYERETVITMNDSEIESKITTWQVVWTKHLIQHPLCTIECIWMCNDNTVVGMNGLIPKTCIRTSTRPRKRFDKF